MKYILKITLLSLILIYIGSCKKKKDDTPEPDPKPTELTVSTLAGTNVGSDDGIGTAAQFNYPFGVAVDANGNLFVVDQGNHSIRKITSTGVVTTLTKSSTQEFNRPSGIALDGFGNLYVTDANNHRIRKITPSGEISTIAGSGTSGSLDGTGTEAQFKEPHGLAIDVKGNIYVADLGNHSIRKITTSGVVTTIAGSGTAGYTEGTGTTAQFSHPYSLTLDANENIYVADFSNHRIRKISPTREVTTFAGSEFYGNEDGPASQAEFKGPAGVAFDASGNLFVCDHINNNIRKISPSGIVTTFAGSGLSGDTDGPAATAKFYGAIGIASDASGNVYVTEFLNHRIRKIALQ